MAKTVRDNVNQRVTFDGRTVTVRTRDALLYAERLWQQRGKHHKRIRLAQGSFSGGSVAASGSTHDGDAVVDIRTAGVGLTAKETVALNRALRDAGFASWIRDERDGMPPHIHAIALADPEAAPSAKRQEADYDKGLNGLTNRAKDRNPYRPKQKVRFSWRQGKPVPR
jgi:hypothetical protein